MSGVSVIDFCCGRTQHDVCRQCGRDFRAVGFDNQVSPGSTIPPRPPLTPRPAPPENPEARIAGLPLFSADFKAGMVIGGLLSSGASLIVFAFAAWWFTR